jgi:hypothetical protein
MKTGDSAGPEDLLFALRGRRIAHEW